jgi:hypothetical protein
MGLNFRDSVELLSKSGFHKVALKSCRSGLGECHHSFRKYAFVKAMQYLIPEMTAGV